MKREMKPEVAEILKNAPALPSEALAGSLLDSLETNVDEDTEAAWATEVNQCDAVYPLPGGSI